MFYLLDNSRYCAGEPYGLPCIHVLLLGTVQNAAGRRRHFSGNIHKGCKIRHHGKESREKSEGDEITVSEKVYVKRKNAKRRMIKTIFGILIMVMGISIFLYPDYREWKTWKEIEKITDGFEKEDKPDITFQMTALIFTSIQPMEKRIPEQKPL